MNAIQTTVAPAMQQAELASLFTTLVLNSDLSKLTEPQRVEYYKVVCDRAGLDPMAKPFDLITLQGKLVLYANKGTTAQLTAIHNLTVTIVSKEVVGSVYVVTARASKPDGASTEDIGAVTITGLQGEAAANAMMKAITKAKRRAVLGVCGLGMLDETETETVPGAERVELPAQLSQEITVRNLTEAEMRKFDALRDTIEGIQDAYGMNAIVPHVRNATSAIRDAIAPYMSARAEALDLVWRGGRYVGIEHAKGEQR